MPRRARVLVPGVPVHLIQRGNNRSACFFAGEDYRFYLEHLAEQAAKQGCAIHAYCLMTNHVHFPLTPAQAESLGGLMKALGQRYVQYVNRTYRRTGTLWEGRFRSCLMQNEGYVLACYRYIELNPVRVGMVAHPAEYRWSSYRANAQGEHTDGWFLSRSIVAWAAMQTAAGRPTGSCFALTLSLAWWIKFARQRTVTTPKAMGALLSGSSRCWGAG